MDQHRPPPAAPMRAKDGWSLERLDEHPPEELRMTRAELSKYHSPSLPREDYTTDDRMRAGNDSDPSERQFTCSANGYIYEYDAPGVPLCDDRGRKAPHGYARVSRNHFLSFAAVIIKDSNGKDTGVQCSELTAWIVSMTVEKLGEPEYSWRLVEWFDSDNGASYPSPRSLAVLWYLSTARF